MENSSSMTAWWRWSSWFSGRASLSTTEEEKELEEDRAAPWERCGCPPTPPLYIGARERGAGPLRSNLRRGRRPRGGGVPPKSSGGPPP